MDRAFEAGQQVKATNLRKIKEMLKVLKVSVLHQTLRGLKG